MKKEVLTHNIAMNLTAVKVFTTLVLLCSQVLGCMAEGDPEELVDKLLSGALTHDKEVWDHLKWTNVLYKRLPRFAPVVIEKGDLTDDDLLEFLYGWDEDYEKFEEEELEKEEAYGFGQNNQSQDDASSKTKGEVEEGPCDHPHEARCTPDRHRHRRSEDEDPPARTPAPTSEAPSKVTGCGWSNTALGLDSAQPWSVVIASSFGSTLQLLHRMTVCRVKLFVVGLLDEWAPEENPIESNLTDTEELTACLNRKYTLPTIWCEGTRLNRLVVLTSAQCVHQMKATLAFWGTYKYHVSLSNDKISSNQLAVATFEHPFFNIMWPPGPIKVNDFALIVMDKEGVDHQETEFLTLPWRVRFPDVDDRNFSVCVPDQPMIFPLGTECIGPSKQEFRTGKPRESHEAVIFKIRDPFECLLPLGLEDTYYCATPLSSSITMDTDYDLGASLACPGTDGKYYLAGVASGPNAFHKLDNFTIRWMRWLMDELETVYGPWEKYSKS